MNAAYKLIFLLIFTVSFDVLSQTHPQEEITKIIPNEDIDRTTVAAGLGLNFGGVGLNGTHYITPKLGAFFGVGWAVVAPGYNVGIKYRTFQQSKNARLYFLGMYGYNTAVVVSGDPGQNSLYYGMSFGTGIDFYNPKKTKYWTFAVIVPVRGKEVMENVKSSLPFTISVGYNFMAN